MQVRLSFLCAFAGESCLMLQQFFRVATGALGDLGAGEHTRELFNAACFIEASDANLRPALQGLLLHDEMAVGKARDLWLVRDAQHLVCLRELL
jgi:hypothetical protein